MEKFCQCGFSAENINEVIEHCFPENLGKINILLLLRPTLSANISTVLHFMHLWINSNPQFSFSESNITLNIDIECDIETIQGSQCKNNPEISTHTGESQSKGQGVFIAGIVLTVLALIILVACPVAVVLIKKYWKNIPALHA